MSIITASKVKKQVGSDTHPIDILKGVDLSVKSSETIAILGASGSGKTTLLSLLAGLDVPTDGDIVLDGCRFSDMTEDQRAQARLGRIGFVFQNFDLLPHLNALENVMLPLELCGMKDPRTVAKDLLQTIQLGDRLHHYPRELSGGEQQRVAIARGYVTSPKVLFADEPTGSLDLNTGKSIIDLLFKLNHEKKTTLIFVTHNEHLAGRCDRALSLKDGILESSSGEF